MSDDPLQLLGPEIMVAQHREESALYAMGLYSQGGTCWGNQILI